MVRIENSIIVLFLLLSACSGGGGASSSYPFGGMCKWNEGVCLNIHSEEVDGSNLQQICSEMTFVLRSAAGETPLAALTPATVISTEEQCSKSNVVSSCSVSDEGVNLSFSFYSPQFASQQASEACNKLKAAN